MGGVSYGGRQAQATIVQGTIAACNSNLPSKFIIITHVKLYGHNSSFIAQLLLSFPAVINSSDTNDGLLVLHGLKQYILLLQFMRK